MVRGADLALSLVGARHRIHAVAHTGEHLSEDQGNVVASSGVVLAGEATMLEAAGARRVVVFGIALAWTHPEHPRCSQQVDGKLESAAAVQRAVLGVLPGAPRLVVHDPKPLL